MRDAPMTLPPEPLADAHVRLEPLGEGHREGLRACVEADQAIWDILYTDARGPKFDGYVDGLVGETQGGTRVAYAVVAPGGDVVGTTSYLNLSLANRALEIGSTYYRPEARAGAVNPACKRLLLANAFERGANRVELRVDARNARSRAACLKLGAKRDGVLRSHLITWTGHVRDSAVYSILRDEWPVVRAGLDARLAGFGDAPGASTSPSPSPSGLTRGPGGVR